MDIEITTGLLIAKLTSELDTMKQFKQHSFLDTFMGHPVDELIKSYEMIISSQIELRATEELITERIAS